MSYLIFQACIVVLFIGCGSSTTPPSATTTTTSGGTASATNGCDGSGNCYVRSGATGAATGADWNNAYTALPATLTRGTTYYIAGGTYPGYTANTPASGTTAITIQAATVASHGTSTGWSSSYATDAGGPGTNPATFGPWQFTTSYWQVTGAGTYTGIGCGNTDPTGYGAGGAGCNIKIVGSTGSDDFAYCPATANSLSACPTNIAASYIEIAGAGYSSGGATTERGIYGDTNGGTTSNGGGSNLSFSHFYIYQVFGVPIFTERVSNFVFDHSYVVGNASSSAAHAEAWADMDSSNVTVSNNAFVGIEGSGDIVELDRGGCQGTCVANNWNIYGNLFWYDSANKLSCRSGACNTGIGDGVIACINALVCTNWTIVQNDFVNIQGLNSGLCEDCTSEGNVKSTWTVENNLWWNNGAVTATLSPGCSSCSMSEDYNSFLNTDVTGASGPHDVTDSSSPTPFAGWNSSPANFQLADENSNWNGGITLDSPYNVDPAGTHRGSNGHWDRGTFQGGSGSSQVSLQSISIAPANPSIAVNGTQQFTATGNYSDGSTKDITALVVWSSHNASVATVSASGLATGVAVGSANINATSGSVTGSATLTVTASVTATLQSITVTPANPSLAVGATQQFTATGSYSDGSKKNITASVSWSSSNASVATVSAGGLATAVVAGSAGVTATSGTISGSTTLTITSGSLSSVAGCDGSGNCYVRAGASGAGTGADWTNAYTALPATLTRGVTYYVAGGKYPAYTANTPASGTTLVTVSAATLASHGTNNGWSSTYATDVNGSGTNPATFGPWQFITGYWNVTGAGTYAGMGCGNSDPSGAGAGGAGCNFQINGTANGNDFAYCAATNNNLSVCPTNISASYIAIIGAGYATGSSNNNEEGIYGDTNGGTTSNGGGSNFTFSHFYIYKVFGGPIFSERAKNITLDHSYIIGSASSSANHHEAWADMASSNVTISNNAFVGIEGSGFIVELDRGGCQGKCIANNWNIYGNLFWYDSGNKLSCRSGACNTGVGDGVIACINALVCTNWTIVQNDFVNILGYNAGLCEDCTAEGNVASNWTVENNLWWNNTSTAIQGLQVSAQPGCSSCTMTEDYNTVLGYLSGAIEGFTGPHDVLQQSTPPSPFVGWSASPANFQLASPSSNLTGGVTLGSPYNTDPNGATRGTNGQWDRGAFQSQ